MRFLVIIHVENEGLGTLEDFLTTSGADIVTARLYNGDHLPGTLRDIDAVISMGGPMNVYEDHFFPFLGEETSFLQSAIEADVPILGICLGAQLIARAAGAPVVKSPYREEGWSSVFLTDFAAKDSLFSGLPQILEVFQWHEDMFHIPEGGGVLAYSEKCPHQAFRYGNALGLQFHLEVTRDLITDWFKESPNLKGLLDDYSRVESSLKLNARTLFSNFLDLVKQNKGERNQTRI
jgi:GMP synthase (glutamine-hydrolysing)